MDYDSLLPRAQSDYKKLEKAIFDDKLLQSGKLNKLAAKLKIKEWQAIMYYAHMLKNNNSPIEYPVAEPVEVPVIAFCPTCSSTKTNAKGCRDYFHII